LFFRNIREEAMKKGNDEERRRKAPEWLLPDYLNANELTAFTVLDREDLYKTN